MAASLRVPITAQPTAELVRTSGKATHVIVGLAKTDDTPTLIGATADLEAEVRDHLGRELLDVALDLGAKCKQDQVVLLPSAGRRVVVVGLGDDVDVEHEVLRNAVASACRAIAGIETDAPHHVAVSLDTNSEASIKAAIEGAILGTYKFAPLSAKDAEQRIERISVVSASTSATAKAAFEAGRATATATCVARDWVNMPANLLYPETFAASAKAYLSDVKVKVEVLDEKALEKGGYGGILTVGGGSERLPRLVRAEYAPKGATFHLVLIGKGITFDTGGYNLKPGPSMITMKCDMAGAAAVLAATHAIAELGLSIKVTTYASMAENMISGRSYRPSDVLTMYGGKTVENVNSDAEGRLVMADALARSNEDNADLVIDIATLTGACVVALGNDMAGLMASDDETADTVLDAAEAAGEAFWQLPITDKLRKSLESKIADTKSGGGPGGGAMTAAAFLQSFLDEGQAWAHLDIAGPAFNAEKPSGLVSEGGTGSGVRTLVALASALQG